MIVSVYLSFCCVLEIRFSFFLTDKSYPLTLRFGGRESISPVSSGLCSRWPTTSYLTWRKLGDPLLPKLIPSVVRKIHPAPDVATVLAVQCCDVSPVPPFSCLGVISLEKDHSPSSSEKNCSHASKLITLWLAHG